MPQMIAPVQVGPEFYNVGEEYTWYDTVAIRQDLDQLSKQPPGWYTTFALFSGANQHSFFNVRNTANCDDAYCNQETRDLTAYAFQADSISCSFWGSGYCNQQFAYPATPYARLWLPNALWQAQLPFESSLTLTVQQDDHVRLNTLMASPGYGPWGGGWANQGNAGQAVVTTNHPNISWQTQGLPRPSARFRFPNRINIPRKAAMKVELSFTAYANDLLSGMPGPGTTTYYNTSDQSAEYPVMYGITVGLHGRRLVQQRGELHA